MPVIVNDVHSIPQLLEAVLGVSRELPDDHFLWFRGLKTEAHTLLPKLMRFGYDYEKIEERERRLLARFRQRSMAYWKEGYSQNEWDHLFAMQHYGAPTRLLDWSENLMVAVFFALHQSVDSTPEADDVPVIWCIDPIRWNRSTPNLEGYGDAIHVLTTVDEETENYKPLTIKRRVRYPIAIFGSHNSERIVAQRGTFMIWGNEPRPLEDFSERDVPCNVWKFRLVTDQGALFHDIQRLGFTETMIFPEMSYLADELNRLEGWR